MLFKDARTYQILFLSLFLIVGIGTRDWTLYPAMVGVAIATCLLTQWLLLIVVKQFSEAPPTATATPASNLPDSTVQASALSLAPLPPSLLQRFRVPLPDLASALITSLGLSLLLRADHYSTMALASALAILSKFLLRVQGKHIFNPANFGIIAALTLTSDAWVSPGQWGEEGWYALLFLGTGGIVLKRVGRWDTTVAFLATYVGLEALRNAWLGWTWDVWLHRLTSGSLLLFALFMITDPRTIPNARSGRILWSIALALLSFWLRNEYFLATALFWALFFLAPCSILLDRLFPASRFVWQEPVLESAESAESAAAVPMAAMAQPPAPATPPLTV